MKNNQIISLYCRQRSYLVIFVHLALLHDCGYVTAPYKLSYYY